MSENRLPMLQPAAPAQQLHKLQPTFNVTHAAVDSLVTSVLWHVILVHVCKPCVRVRECVRLCMYVACPRMRSCDCVIVCLCVCVSMHVRMGTCE